MPAGTPAAELLAAVADGLAHPVELPEPNGDDLDRHLRPAVTLVSAWVSQLARDQRIDTALLATRADLVDLLRGDPDARLAHGWRAETVGDDIRHLVAGDAALAFDGQGGLRLLNLWRSATPSGRGHRQAAAAAAAAAAARGGRRRRRRRWPGSP